MGRKRSASKKAKISAETPDSTMAPQEELETSNVFSHDMDTLECEICSLPFDSQIFMCKNGHAACGNCCIGMTASAPAATSASATSMNHKFRKLGCGETVKFTELRSHEEEACPYAPYSCPFDGCAYRGALLYDHVRDEHALAPAPNCDTGGLLRGASVTLRRDEPAVHALLHGDRVSVILLLNGGDVLAGRSLSLVRICPHPKPGQEDEEVEYRMVVTRDEPEPGTGSPSLAASGKVQYVRRLEGYRPRHFLFVPDAFWGSSGSVVVTVTTTVTVHL